MPPNLSISSTQVSQCSCWPVGERTMPNWEPGGRQGQDAAHEHLNLELFTSLLEAKVVTEDWRIDYNESRPHGALGGMTPKEFAASCAQAAFAPLNQPGRRNQPVQALT